MTITRDDVVNAAKLSRLRLSDDEVAALTKDLERVVGYVEQLMQVNVDGVEPMTQPILRERAPRADEVKDVIGRRALEGGPGYDESAGLVKVPKVIE